MLELLTNTSNTVSMTFYVAGVAIDVVSPSITVYRKLDNTVLVATVETVHVDIGEYEYVLAPQTVVDSLYAVWTGTVDGVLIAVRQELEIVENFLFDVEQARIFGEKDLASLTTFPSSKIADDRWKITQEFTRYLRASPIRRFAYERHDGNGKPQIYLDHSRVNSLIRVTVDGVSQILDDLNVYEDGLVRSETIVFTSGQRNILFEYNHGMESVPGEIQRAGLLYVTARVAGNEALDRVITHTDETGTYRLSTANRYDKPTGYPYIDAILNGYAEDW